MLQIPKKTVLYSKTKYITWFTVLSFCGEPFFAFIPISLRIFAKKTFLAKISTFIAYSDASPSDIRRYGASYPLGLEVPLPADIAKTQKTVFKKTVSAFWSTPGRCGCIAITGRNFCLSCGTVLFAMWLIQVRILLTATLYSGSNAAIVNFC